MTLAPVFPEAVLEEVSSSVGVLKVGSKQGNKGASLVGKIYALLLSEGAKKQVRSGI